MLVFMAMFIVWSVYLAAMILKQCLNSGTSNNVIRCAPRQHEQQQQKQRQQDELSQQLMNRIKASITASMVNRFFFVFISLNATYSCITWIWTGR
jgi:hypothetical protein